MFKGEKVIFHGSGHVTVPVGLPIGTEGIVIGAHGSNHYVVHFENHGQLVCKKTSLSSFFMSHDRIKIIGPIDGTHDRFIGLEGIVKEILTGSTIIIRLELGLGSPRDLFVEASSLERIEPKGSKWWV